MCWFWFFWICLILSGMLCLILVLFLVDLVIWVMLCKCPSCLIGCWWICVSCIMLVIWIVSWWLVFSMNVGNCKRWSDVCCGFVFACLVCYFFCMLICFVICFLLVLFGFLCLVNVELVKLSGSLFILLLSFWFEEFWNEGEFIEGVVVVVDGMVYFSDILSGEGIIG